MMIASVYVFQCLSGTTSKGRYMYGKRWTEKKTIMRGKHYLILHPCPPIKVLLDRHT